MHVFLSRCTQSKQFGKAAFDQLYATCGGYEEPIGFTLWEGNQRKAKFLSRQETCQCAHEWIYLRFREDHSYVYGHS